MNKNSPARLATNARYNSKTYDLFGISLRKDDDAEIIESIRNAQENGISYREWLRDLYYNR